MWKEDMYSTDYLIDVLKREMMPAMGCTEPAAAALCGARVRELLGVEKPALISVRASRKMIKNTMGVGIPSSDNKGLKVAVALGYAVGSTSKGLSILSDVSEECRQLADSIDVSLTTDEDAPSLYVSVRAETAGGRYALATVSGSHERFSRLEKDGEVLLSLPLEAEKNSTGSLEELKSLSFEDVISFADSVEMSRIRFVPQAVSTNYSIARHSIKGGFGLEVGKTMLEGISDPPSALKDAFSKGAAYAAAGADARMSGCPMPVIINSGSGNQGITVTVPVKVVADYLQCGDEKTARAVCISELVGLILAARKNRLSALCGVFTASIGTACAWVYLLDGGADMMKSVVNTMVANLAGIICDGAKITCALKLYSSLECASMSVRLALKGFCPGSESGIVGDTITQTIDNLSRISNEGMEETDKTVVSIMMDKDC